MTLCDCAVFNFKLLSFVLAYALYRNSTLYFFVQTLIRFYSDQDYINPFFFTFLHIICLLCYLPIVNITELNAAVFKWEVYLSMKPGLIHHFLYTEMSVLSQKYENCFPFSFWICSFIKDFPFCISLAVWYYCYFFLSFQTK